MGRGLTLVVVAIVAVVLGVVGTAVFAQVAVVSSAKASADAERAVAEGSLKLDKPEGYGSR